MSKRRWAWHSWTAGLLWAALVGACGCGSSPSLLAPSDRKPLDRKYVEYPAGTELAPLVESLTAPTAICFDAEGSLLIAEGGVDGNPARVFGYKKTGEFFQVWPRGRRFPFGRGYEIYGPVGGMVAGHGRVYVTHRDEEGRGVITRFDYEGNCKPLVGELPARGDHSVTDIALARDGRLFFGVGSATNSGVVGLDNIEWLRRNRPVCDEAWTDPASAALYLNGWRFDSTNPFAGLFGGSDVSVTAPFQPFGRSLETRIPRCATGMPNAAVFSINPEGGDLRVEAFGVRNPVGLGFNDVGRLFLTNQGMKLRGTRPVKDDPDVLLRMVSGQWYGWPDFSANLLPIQEARFQPPREMIVKSGYGELSFLIDHQRSNLRPPTRRQENLLAAEFPALAGAAKFDFIPSSGPLARLGEGRDVAIVALSGDRAPFDTGGLDLIAPMGYKLVAVRLGPGLGRVEEFIRNTRQGPSSKHRDRPGDAVELERPIDVKFGPDGAMYILDFGRMEMYGPRQRVTPGSGRVLKLTGIAEPTTRP